MKKLLKRRPGTCVERKCVWTWAVSAVSFMVAERRLRACGCLRAAGAKAFE